MSNVHPILSIIFLRTFLYLLCSTSNILNCSPLLLFGLDVNSKRFGHADRWHITLSDHLADVYVYIWNFLCCSVKEVEFMSVRMDFDAVCSCFWQAVLAQLIDFQTLRILFSCACVCIYVCVCVCICDGNHINFQVCSGLNGVVYCSASYVKRKQFWINNVIGRCLTIGQRFTLLPCTVFYWMLKSSR